jgi:hypothetical protein
MARTLAQRDWILSGLAVVGLLSAASGCQVSVNGQTLPSAYYLQDDVQYFPAGPEFKLPREAAALEAARAEESLERAPEASF